MTRGAADMLDEAAAVIETVAMPTLLEDVPVGYSWGFHTREEPRMHVQTLRSGKARHPYKVWLENRGERIFQPLQGIPTDVLDPLRAAVQEQEILIEEEWVNLMIQKEWLTVRLDGTVVTLTAYPRTAHQFQRWLDLAEEFSGSAAPGLAAQGIKLDPKTAMLAVGVDGVPEHSWNLVPLPDILFLGSRF